MDHVKPPPAKKQQQQSLPPPAMSAPPPEKGNSASGAAVDQSARKDFESHDWERDAQWQRYLQGVELPALPALALHGVPVGGTPVKRRRHQGIHGRRSSAPRVLAALMACRFSCRIRRGKA